MSNGADFIEAQADRHWASEDFGVEYVEWCEENEEEPTEEGQAEFYRERAEDMDYDAYRERDL